MINISGKPPGLGEGSPERTVFERGLLQSVAEAMLRGASLPLAWDGSGSVSGPEPGLIAPSEVSPEE
jgi:hypothetical protein